MDLVQSILHYFQNSENQTKSIAPQGTCAMCWGYQEYDGKLRRLFKDRQIDINNHQDSYTLIQDFVKKHIDKVKLQEGEVTICPNCQTSEEDTNDH